MLIYIIIKVAIILIIADGIGSILLPSRCQSHSWWLDGGRLGRTAIGVFLFFVTL